MRQLVITKCDSFIYYKVRQLVITKCDSYFITKCDKSYYKVRQVLQSVTVLLQSATGITKCDDYYKVRQNRGSRHLLCHQTGQGLALRTDVIRGVRSAKLEGGRGGYELACCVVPTGFF